MSRPKREDMDSKDPALKGLTQVEIETTLGEKYLFPDMDIRVFEKVVAQEEMWRKLGSLALSNISGACLVIPTRIIKEISVVEAGVLHGVKKVLWKASPVSTANSQ